MTYKLFVDDIRFPTTPDWFVARSSCEAIQAIRYYGMPIEMALDHDLGGDDTIMVFLSKVENMLLNGECTFPPKFSYTVHSVNPIGARNANLKMKELIKLSGELE